MLMRAAFYGFIRPAHIQSGMTVNYYTKFFERVCVMAVARPRGRWWQGAALLALIILVSLAMLAAADAWMIKDGAQRCAAQFPKWLGCVVANHEDLAGRLIAAGGALFAAWVAWHAVMDQIESDKELARDAVRPLAYIMVGDYENQVFVKVVNNGTGPMIIKSIMVNDKPQPLIDAMPDLPDGIQWANFVEDTGNRSVSAGGELVLIELSSPSNEDVSPEFANARDLVRRALGDLTVCVRYTDIYDKNQPAAERWLNWFHRVK
jgi:hypothetical protein